MGDPQSFQTTHADSGASKEDVVETRALLDVSSPRDVKNRMDHFFMNDPSGVFSISVLADIFVRVGLFICTYLVLRLCCWRAKEREIRLTELQLQRYLDRYMESQRRYLRSDSYIRRVTQAAQSSLAPPSVPASPVQVNSTDSTSACRPLGQRSSTIVLQSVATEDFTLVSSSNDPPTECMKVVGAEQKGSRPHDLQPRRRVNGTYSYDQHMPDGSRSLELASTSSSDSSKISTPQSRTVPTQAHKGDTGEDVVNDVVIDIFTVQGVFPTSASMEIGNKWKHIVKDKVDVSCDHDISSSRIIQTRVSATDENLSALRDIAVEGMKLDKGFTLQIGGSFMYYCNGNPEEPVLLSLRDIEVPTVLQADYSAGVLSIRGRYLEGAEIRAATFDGYMILKSIKQDQINNNILPPERRIEVWRCTDLLPPVKLDQIQICASKSVLTEGYNVTVRSEVSSIQNTSLRTVIRNWVPTAILIVFLASQAWFLLALLLNLVTDPLYRTWLSYPILALAVYIIQLLPSSLEDNIKDFMERLKLAISSFHVLPDLLSSPAFFMRNGYCFQRGAKHLVDGKLIVEGAHQKELSDSSKSDEIPPTSKHWKWPCFEEGYSERKKKMITWRFDPDSKQNPDYLSHPFTVTYCPEASPRLQNNVNFPLQYIPQLIVVKLYSKYLQATIRDLLPNSIKLFKDHGEIQAKDLLILQISKVLEKKMINLDTESNDPLASYDEIERNRLDLSHLIRFVKKEYEEIITQYERMMEADAISWDMLWTLIVPKADVIYYCDISKEELCGKVLSTDYVTDYSSVPETIKFRIELEVCDYNCINFEVVRIQCIVLPFKEEVKISDIDVYPLQRKANSQKAEEFFLMRGRKFYDLVLKYERRFMQYKGLIYIPPLTSKVIRSSGTSRSRLISTSTLTSWRFDCKEIVDGRVMIDQGNFAKMKPSLSMDTAQPPRGWLQGNGFKMKNIIDESDPLLKYAPAIVYGFSFSVRKWRCFTIEGMSEIQFISTAFDTLVMNEDIKNTLLTLTEHHIKHPQGSKDVATNVDVLPNKGKGCIVLLHGPPGTGKTLTVESLAEKLECPLWQLSISKNFRSTEELETDLLTTFEIAASWRAILVLDEADVYLSSRKYSPLSSDVTQTNAMTGVFLRVLEYYTGILFLTTNVIDSIEPAIYSRLSLFVKYEEFSIESRKQLWINFLNRIGFQHPSQEFWDRILSEKFNGRVIRNIIQNAQILALSKGLSLSEEHLLKAFQVMATPFTMSHMIESEDKPDSKQASTTVSTHAPSVVTDSTLSHLAEDE